MHRGLEILEKVNEAAVDPDDLPLQRITIISCGLTDAQVPAMHLFCDHLLNSYRLKTIRHTCHKDTGKRYSRRTIYFIHKTSGVEQAGDRCIVQGEDHSCSSENDRVWTSQ